MPPDRRRLSLVPTVPLFFKRLLTPAWEARAYAAPRPSASRRSSRRRTTGASCASTDSRCRTFEAGGARRRRQDHLRRAARARTAARQRQYDARIRELHERLRRDAGVYHNDVQYKNVLVDAADRLYLIDFELASRRFADADLEGILGMGRRLVVVVVAAAVIAVCMVRGAGGRPPPSHAGGRRSPLVHPRLERRERLARRRRVADEVLRLLGGQEVERAYSRRASSESNHQCAMEKSPPPGSRQRGGRTRRSTACRRRRGRRARGASGRRRSAGAARRACRRTAARAAARGGRRDHLLGDEAADAPPTREGTRHVGQTGGDALPAASTREWQASQRRCPSRTGRCGRRGRTGRLGTRRRRPCRHRKNCRVCVCFCRRPWYARGVCVGRARNPRPGPPARKPRALPSHHRKNSVVKHSAPSSCRDARVIAHLLASRWRSDATSSSICRLMLICSRSAVDRLSSSRSSASSLRSGSVGARHADDGRRRRRRPAPAPVVRRRRPPWEGG